MGLRSRESTMLSCKSKGTKARIKWKKNVVDKYKKETELKVSWISNFIERCKASVELFKLKRLYEDTSQQDWRYSFYDSYLIYMKLYSKELPGWH